MKIDVLSVCRIYMIFLTILFLFCFACWLVEAVIGLRPEIISESIYFLLLFSVFIFIWLLELADTKE